MDGSGGFSTCETADTDVTFVLPCLNEARSLGACFSAISQALATLASSHSLRGEILLADNGSSDGSQALAKRLGARVVDIAEKGYGAALRGGFAAARGRYLVMGDADGSYDFREAVPMVEKLIAGAGLCVGSRFKGGVKPGAMPWKNRYIGNPLLTGILNLLFKAGISDAHCGLRAISRDTYLRLGLTGAGMEFASEMIIKAALLGEKIVETPATLSPDLRDRPPHLRPWRDGWRHLRYLFMLSPLWLFALPALFGAVAGSAILGAATWRQVFAPGQPFFLGNYWVVLAAAMIGVSQVAAILAAASYLSGLAAGYRRSQPWVAMLARWVRLETMIIAGSVCFAFGLTILGGVVIAWSQRDFHPATTVLPAVSGALFLTLGAQNVLGGFLLSIIGGNEARFLALPTAQAVTNGRRSTAHALPGPLQAMAPAPR